MRFTEVLRSSFGKRFAVATACYVSAVAGGTLIVNRLDPVPQWVAVAVASVALVPAAAMLWIGPWMMRHEDGVERWVLYRGATVAFFLTMAMLLGIGLLEGFANMPPLSAWWVYGVGMMSWGVATFLLQRHSVK